MMPRATLSPESLLESCPALTECLSATWPIQVAFSGGCDSLVLLHLMYALLHERGSAGRLRAIHVNHNLQEDSARWASHCRRVCRLLGVRLQVVSLDGAGIRQAEGGSLENSARQARYACFERLLPKQAVLLQAHHADDQVETMLFRILRGSGLRGLSGIPASRPLGKGQLLRPLLTWARADIEDYARRNDLQWVEDPSNARRDFDRNYLRHEVMPVLRARWPSATEGFLRSRELIQEARDCNDALAILDLREVITASGRLSVSGLCNLPLSRQRNLLRHHLDSICSMRGVAGPDYVTLRRVTDEVLRAGASANPVVRWPKGEPCTEVRRYADELWFLPTLAAIPADISWSGRDNLRLGHGLGNIRLERVKQGGFQWNGEPLSVRFNVKGLSIQRAGRPSRSLGRLCQELRLPPWHRERLPLLFSGQTLLSVADLLIPADVFREEGAGLYRLVWSREDLH